MCTTASHCEGVRRKKGGNFQVRQTGLLKMNYSKLVEVRGYGAVNLFSTTKPEQTYFVYTVFWRYQPISKNIYQARAIKQP